MSAIILGISTAAQGAPPPSGSEYAITVGEWSFNNNVRGYGNPSYGNFGSIDVTTFGGATIQVIQGEELGGVFYYTVQLSGVRAQTFFTSVEVEYDPGVTFTVLSSAADDFGDDGISTWWTWNSLANGWTSGDTGLTRAVTIT